MASSLLITGGHAKSRLKEAEILAAKKSHRFDTVIVDTLEEKGIEAAKKVIGLSSKKPFQSELNSIIILEAQNLTIEAQNSLLKTLEEPPENTQLILTAPNQDSVLPTIASRCLKHNLRTQPSKIAQQTQSTSKLSERLAQIEKISLEDQIVHWNQVLKQALQQRSADSVELKKLHRYNKTLLKLRRAEKFAVNKKLLSLIAALEQPNQTGPSEASD